MQCSPTADGPYRQKVAIVPTFIRKDKLSYRPRLSELLAPRLVVIFKIKFVLS